MAALLVNVRDAPAAPLDAASQFHSAIVPDIRKKLAKAAEIVIVFEPADHSHRAWRLAAVQELAREVAPARANAIVGSDDSALAETLDYLAHAPGITGQLLAVDGKSAKMD